MPAISVVIGAGPVGRTVALQLAEHGHDVRLLTRSGSVVSRDLRELAEMLYQFQAPFVMDSARSEALLGLSPTPLDQAAAEPVAWWRQRA